MTQATIEDCQIVGTSTCGGGMEEYELSFSGEANQAGEASGPITGDLGDMGSLDTEWVGTVDGGGFSGEFYQELPWEDVEGQFHLTPI